MSKPDLKPKSKNKLYFGIIAIVLIVIIVAAAAFYSGAGSSGGTPTLSSKAGTYVEQGGSGYTINLYANGTATFDSRLGTWSIMNSTTFEGTYTILFSPHTSYFTFNNNGFTSDTGKVYVKSK
jgi:hypothetical protein